jgi:hypothetical protein
MTDPARMATTIAEIDKTTVAFISKEFVKWSAPISTVREQIRV